MAAVLAMVVGWAQPAAAQVDPMLVVKRSLATFTSVDYRAHVLLAVDASERMQWGYEAKSATDVTDDRGMAVSSSDLANKYFHNYYDPYDYTCNGDAFLGALNLSGCAVGTRYRRLYQNLNLSHTVTDVIRTVANDASGASAYARFYDRSRMGAARKALAKAVRDNGTSVRFGLIKTRQQLTVPVAVGTVASAWADLNPDYGQDMMTDDPSMGLWKIMRPRGTVNNTSLATLTVPLVQADAAGANANVLTILERDPGAAGSLVGAGNDSETFEDAPLETLLEDAKAEASRLINADGRCRNTVVVLITGGRENTSGHSPTATALAATFRNISARRVPIYVVGIEPSSGINNSTTDTDVELLAIANASGGRYFRVSAAEIEFAAQAGTPVPGIVAAINAAIQHGYANPADVNAVPTISPFGPRTETQVTSPIVGTVDLYGATFADGTGVPDSESRITSQTGTELPQRSNLIVTSGFSLPGFEGMLRGFRVYKPVADATKPSGYKFVADGRKLWDARPPMLGDGVRVDGARRNIFTVLANGSVVPFTEDNWSLLAAPLTMTAVSEREVRQAIYDIRALPLGPIVSSTPAILDPPSVDPPPDDEYPAFVDANKGRRTLVFVGANDGMLHAIDGRTGLEVWAFIPYNLLPKMKHLRYGQAVDGFLYTMDGSPKIADVKVGSAASKAWKTYLIVGQGSGGTFYQTFDVTMPNLEDCVAKDATASESTLLACFNSASRIPLAWTFPQMSHFDVTRGTYGDLGDLATAVEKTVGQTWSDPAVGQIENQDGTYAVLAGSGFFPRSAELSSARGGVAAGRSFYLIDVNDGSVTDSKDVGSDGRAETVDDCAVALPNGCSQLKNALQGDPVATGPPDSRFITKAYLGDLDGNLWRFNVAMQSGVPKFTVNPTRLYAAGADQPMFASMAAVTVGTQQYLFFGGGSDLLPSPGINGSFKLYGLLEGQNTPSFTYALERSDGVGNDERVSAFPAVAGDIVFFSTTNLKPGTPCTKPDANLYAFTFIGGAAYDNTGDDQVRNSDTPRVISIAQGGRATAPFIVDQHLWFGTGSSVSSFGDPQDFNNGVGQMGVRILSWRQVR
jgi:hypothetical protein